MNIQELLNAQVDLIRRYDYSQRMSALYKTRIEQMEKPCDKENLEHAKTVETRLLVLAALDEFHEVLKETNWKPWKRTQRSADRQKIAAELADVMHFWLELVILWNLEDDIESAIENSFLKNKTRVQTGY